MPDLDEQKQADEREVTDSDIKEARDEGKVRTGKPSVQQLEAEEQAEDRDDENKDQDDDSDKKRDISQALHPTST